MTSSPVLIDIVRFTACRGALVLEWHAAAAAGMLPEVELQSKGRQALKQLKQVRTGLCRGNRRLSPRVHLVVWHPVKFVLGHVRILQTEAYA